MGIKELIGGFSRAIESAIFRSEQNARIKKDHELESIELQKRQSAWVEKLTREKKNGSKA